MNTWIKYSLLVLLSINLLYSGILPAFKFVHSDFSNYYVSARLVVDKKELKNIYDNQWFADRIKEYKIDEPGKFAPFPPITAWVMIPLTFTDALTAKQIFTVFNCLLLLFCVWLIKKLTGWDLASSSLLMLAAGNGLINNFKFGQLYLLIMFGMLLIIYFDRRSKEKFASVILGFITCVKYLPIVLLSSFLLLKKYRILFYSVISIFGFILLQYIFFGNEVMKQFIISTLLPHLNGEIAGQGMDSYLFQSWDSLLRNIYKIPSGNNIATLSHLPLGLMIFKCIIYFLVGSSLVIPLRLIKKSVLSEKFKTNMICSLPILAAFAILPASASYHFILLVVPITLILSLNEFTKKEKIAITLLYASIGIIPYGLFFKIANYAGVVFAYPRLFICLTLYIICIYIAVRASKRIQAP